MEELHVAIREGDLYRVQRLTEGNHGLVDIVDDKGKTAVSIAIEKCDDKIVKWLIENGCRLSRSGGAKFGMKSQKRSELPAFAPDLVSNADNTNCVNRTVNGLVQCVNRSSEQDSKVDTTRNMGPVCADDIPGDGVQLSASDTREDVFYPPLLAAVSVGSYEMTKTVLESQRAHVEDSFKKVTPLLKACIEGHTEIVGLLIKYGADVNGRCVSDAREASDSQWFHRPLYHAVQNNRSEIVEMLVLHGATYLQVVPLETYSFHVADPSTVSHRALATLLELAVRRCQPAVVGFLIDSFHSEITDLGRYYALVWSVKFQQTGMTEVLIEKLYPESYRMEADECCDKYRQVLRIAVRECPQADETVPLLLLKRFGKALFPQEDGFFIILHSAVLRSLPKLVISLLEITKDPSCKFDISHYESWPDLCSAALYYGNKQILSALYDSGCLDLTTQCDGENAFFEAIFCGKNGASVHEILAWLVECGLDPSACDNNKMQPIHAAVTHRLNSAVDALCRLGVDANARMGTDDLPTPLHLQLNLRVLQLGCDLNLDLIKVLVGHGADLAMENRKGYTPISILFWLLHANIRLQEVTTLRAADAGQGQNVVTAGQPGDPSNPSTPPASDPPAATVDRASETSRQTADAATADTRESGRTEQASNASSSSSSERDGTETAQPGQGIPDGQSRTVDAAHVFSPPTSGRGSHIDRAASQGSNSGTGSDSPQASSAPPVPAPDPVVMPTYLQAGSPWKTFIELLADRFGVELFSMGAARLTGPQHWRKVYASLLQAGIDMGHLPTLRTMCWVLIRRRLGGVRFCEKVNELPLPEVMKTYLKCL